MIDCTKIVFTYRVQSHVVNFQSQLQALFDRAPHLHQLTINNDESIPLQMSLFNHIKASIRHLDKQWCKSYFNEEECITYIIVRSSFTTQNEILFVGVRNRESIVNLVNNMINLRALSFRYE